MILGSFLEFILGNTFPFVVFGSFGAFWLTYAATLTPYYNASIAYDPTHPAAAFSNPVFASTFAYFQLYMSLLCFVFLICSLRTNVVFFSIFLLLVPAFGCLAGAFWKIAEGTPDALETALKAQHAAGGLTFAVALLGWYLLFVQLLASVDFPLNLPVGDLSRFIKGASERTKAA
jgi:succinate-acetate transporter protein